MHRILTKSALNKQFPSPSTLINYNKNIQQWSRKGVTVRGFRRSFTFRNYDKFIYWVKYLLSIEPMFSNFLTTCVVEIHVCAFDFFIWHIWTVGDAQYSFFIGIWRILFNFLKIDLLSSSFCMWLLFAFCSQINCSFRVFTFSTFPSFYVYLDFLHKIHFSIWLYFLFAIVYFHQTLIHL